MLAVKRNDQNATIRELQHPNNSEENVQHIMTSSQAVPIHCGDTEVLQGRSVLNDSGDQNDNNLSRYTSAKNDCSDPVTHHPLQIHNLLKELQSLNKGEEKVKVKCYSHVNLRIKLERQRGMLTNAKKKKKKKKQKQNSKEMW
ncbi:uncharacterized protein LOC126162474 isoform X2 [Schistocerca cancellata]|uniref:uncharacterized protein LOC126162474 isoform X2 n=1 Tax=Schistocerca cancellata TaxID=274614 RepID=UPI002117D466|nr:uncharacterized protein LOC126162474 isoform X2 [Schistocerca cancellata]